MDIGIEPETLYPKVIPRRPLDNPANEQEHGEATEKKRGQGSSSEVKIAKEVNTQTFTTASKERRSWSFAQRLSRHWRISTGGSTLIDARPSTSSSADVKTDGGHEEPERVTIDVQTLSKDDGSAVDVHVDASPPPATASSTAHPSPPHTAHAITGHLYGRADIRPPNSVHGRSHSHSRTRHRTQAQMQELLVLEEEEDRIDAVQPLYDQLKINKAWWVIEYMPWSYRYQLEDGSWKKKFG